MCNVDNFEKLEKKIIDYNGEWFKNILSNKNELEKHIKIIRDNNVKELINDLVKINKLCYDTNIFPEFKLGDIDEYVKFSSLEDSLENLYIRLTNIKSKYNKDNDINLEIYSIIDGEYISYGHIKIYTTLSKSGEIYFSMKPEYYFIKNLILDNYIYIKEFLNKNILKTFINKKDCNIIINRNKCEYYSKIINNYNKKEEV